MLTRVEARVRDGYRGPTGQLLSKPEILFVVAAAGLGVDQGQRAERTLPGTQRHDDCGPKAELTHHTQVLRVTGTLDQEPIGDLRVELSAPGPDDVRDARWILGIDRVAGAKGLGELDLLGIDVCGGRVADLAALADELNAAPIPQAGHRQPRQLVERAIQVERTGHDSGRVREKGKPLARVRCLLEEPGV